MELKRIALVLRGLALTGAAIVLTRPFTIADAALPLIPQIALSLPPYLCIAWGLLRLAGFSGHVAREQHFTRAAARSLMPIGWAILAAAVLLPMTRLIALFYTRDASLAEMLTIALRPPTVISVTMGLIFGTIIVLFSALLEKSVQLQDENSSFV